MILSKSMHNKENLLILLVILFSRTTFLFGDAIFSAKSLSIKESPKTIAFVENNLQSSNNVWNDDLIHNSADDTSNQISADDTLNQSSNIWLQDLEDHYDKVEAQNNDKWLEQNDLDLKDLPDSFDSISILENIYKKNNSSDVLKVLIDKLLSDYQFSKAKSYISNIDILNDTIIDAKSYIYTYINTISVTDPNSMSKFMSFIDQIKYKALISSDDYLLYQALSKLWNKDYDWANLLLKQIKSPIYNNFVIQIDDSINKFNTQKWVPTYYKDSLMALVAMKNGYFSLANKLSVDSILQNREYILPYQILAYSNFLTNNREKAIESFYELNSLDIENQDKYNFHIWVSYYRLWNYQKSILTLSQLANTSEYKLDSYRYLLLNYQKLEDEEKMIQLWQKILWQNNLKESDFKTFYDIVFYRPFSTDSKYTIYNKYRQISYDYISMCYEKFGQKNDTCLYWEVWLDVANESRQDVENSLVYLSENYPQASIFQALWDYYKYQKLDDKSKTYYLKAISLSNDISQKNSIEQSLVNIIE